MKATEIFIVTYWKDLPWLEWCLKSITKFATGFSGVTVVAPKRDVESALPICKIHNATLKYFNEIEGKGMLHHMAINCSADEFVNADYVLHMDSDCIFFEPVSPEDYFHDGKPILLKQKYEELKETGVYQWKERTERALNRPVLYETMRRHPSVHPLRTYKATRDAVEAAHRRPFLDWAVDGQNEFPQFWSEFNLLGAVAHSAFPEEYFWIDTGHEPWPPNKMAAFWSHGGLEAVSDRFPFAGRKAIDVMHEFIGK